MLRPLNKHTVLKEVRTMGLWVGYIAPNNVSEYHVTNGWQIGMGIEIFDVIEEDGTHKPYVNNQDNTATPLETVLSSYKYYNCIPELGNRIRFWEVY